MMRLRTLCAALCLLGLSAPALAQGSDAAQSEAKARFKEGKALYAQGKVDDARLKFLQACAVLQDDACIRNLSVAEYYSGHYVEAYRDIKSLLARGVLKADPAEQREFEEMARQAYDKTGHIQIKCLDGAVVTIDEREKAGTCPIPDPVDVVVGKHVVVARKDDQIERREVEAVAGKIVALDLTPVTVAVVPGGGEVVPPGGGDVVPPPHTEHVRPLMGWIVPGIVGGVGLVGLVVGMAEGAVSQGAKSDADALFARGVCADRASAGCVAYEDKVNAKNSATTVSVIGYVGGGVLIATAAVLFVVWPKQSRVMGSVVPVFSDKFAGLSWVGRF